MSNELWQAFVEEVSEQLDKLEVTLATLMEANAEEVNAIFRLFHSIKSSCAMFEFDAMEEIAHASENILDQVRNQVLQPSAEVIDVLLESVDCLKSQLKASIPTMEPPERKPELLNKICDQLVTSSTNQGGEQQQTMEVDAVECEELAYFLSDILDALFESILKQEHELTIRFAEKIRKACERLELFQLKIAFQQIKSWPELDESERTFDKLKEQLVRVADQFTLLTELTNVEFTLSPYYTYTSQLFGLAVHEELSAYIDAVAGGAADEQAYFESVCDIGERVVNSLKVLGLQHCVRFFAFVNQYSRKCLLGQAVLHSDQKKLVTELGESILAVLGDDKKVQDIELLADSSLASFRKVIASEQEDGFGRLDRIAAVTAALNIEADYLDYSDNHEIELLEQCIKENRLVAYILVDIEADQAWSLAFVEWLHNYEIITSRTVLTHKVIDGKDTEYTKTSFLVVFDKDKEAIQKELDAIGNENGLIEQFIFKDNHTSTESREVYGGSNKIVKALGTNQSLESESNKTLRINSNTVDRFVAQVGEMVLQRNMLSHTIKDNDVESLLRRGKQILAKDSADLAKENIDELKEILQAATDFHEGLKSSNDKLSNSVSLVQDEVMSLRVVPISIVFNRLPRVVRNINIDMEKDIRLTLKGDTVRVDKSLVDILMEPLIHIVRNCADHGIESCQKRESSGKPRQSKIEVSAQQSGSMLEVSIADDGQGLDFEKIAARSYELGLIQETMDVKALSEQQEAELKKMIFMPGFSTSETISETSGRGVGMDVVKNRIASVGGSIDIETTRGKGTCFTLKLPISAAIQGVILCKDCEEILAIPERHITQGITFTVEDLQSVSGQAAFVHHGGIVPVYKLSELLSWKQTSTAEEANSDEYEIIIISNDYYRIGIMVEKILDRQEIFVRDLHRDLMALPGVAGASILGNGNVVLILDPEELLDIASKKSQKLSSLLRAVK